MSTAPEPPPGHMRVNATRQASGVPRGTVSADGEGVPTSPTPPPLRPWWAAQSSRPFLTPRQVRTRTLRTTIATALTAVVAIGGLGWFLNATEVRKVVPTTFGALEYLQSNNALIAGCGPVFKFPDAVAGSGIVPRRNSLGITNRQAYPTTVPMMGKFWDEPLTAAKGGRFVERDAKNKPVAENLLRNMWDGAMVIYYDAAVPEAAVEDLRVLAKADTGLDVYVAPWEATSTASLPQGRDVAFVAWGATQTCHTYLAPALYDFREAAPADTAPGYAGENPPVLEEDPEPAQTIPTPTGAVSP